MGCVYILTHFSESDRFKVVRYASAREADKALEEPGESDEMCYYVANKSDLGRVPLHVLLLIRNAAVGAPYLSEFSGRPDADEQGWNGMVEIVETREGEVIQGTVPDAKPKRVRNRKMDPEEKTRRAAERQAEREAKRAEKAAAKETTESEESDSPSADEREAARAKLRELEELMKADLATLRESLDQTRKHWTTSIAEFKEANKHLLGGRSAPLGPRRSFKDIGFARPPFAENIKQARAGTKVALMIDLLSRPEGVLKSELKAAMDATGQPVNVRAWLGYDLNDKHGYGFRSEPEGDDHRLYIVYPEGMDAPLPHLTGRK